MPLSPFEQTRLDLVARLTDTSRHRTEATIQSDVRILLLDPDLGLAAEEIDVQLEAQVGQQRRIDVEAGATAIEVKRSLASHTVTTAAIDQLTDYVQTRTSETGQQYTGILTDGVLWIAFREVNGHLREATRHVTTPGTAGAHAILAWLEGVLATKRGVRPTPVEIKERLGAESSSHALDNAALAALYEAGRDLPTVALKRELWADLLQSALGTQFTDDDSLFLEHTLLVNSAEIIAHLVLGLDAQNLAPATLLSGDQFARAGLYGVVDRDFFDWVIEVPGGDAFISSLARKLARFDWSAVEHDVLKVLYESVIPAATRKSLGEYYTPDWLAFEVVSEAVTDPLNQRVLDPSCGSGSFLFYAVRRYLAAADAAGVSLVAAMHDVSSRVIGIDLHPVAVALARVTYLLALGRDRLIVEGRGDLHVPVYLGDSLGWDQEEDLLSLGHLVVKTEVGDQVFSTELRFADHLLADAARFDDLVQALVDESGRAAGTRTAALAAGTVRRLGLSDVDAAALAPNFVRLRQLHEANRDHIWSYYIRNVSRPRWLSREENRVDVLVGNPPWLSYRHMSAGMQSRFKLLAQDRGLWHDETTATHQDLAGLFIARAVEQYLTSGGRFGFVVPNAVLDRDYWSGFRRGRFSGANVNFAPSWDLRRLRPHLFPRGSAVVFGHRQSDASPMPADITVWAGRAPAPHTLAGAPLGTITRTSGLAILGAAAADESPYRSRFAQGANLVPRVLFRVEPDPAASLGAPAGRRALRSERTAGEKPPWKTLPPMTGSVETEFLWPTVLGESVVPFRILTTATFVVPMQANGALHDPAGATIDRWPGLADWMRRAAGIWEVHRTGKLSLTEQINHMGKLEQQAPLPSTRVVYAASGMHLSAAVLRDPNVLVEHGLYWATVTSPDEARFLVGILNTPGITDLVRPLMSYGKDERHVDKHVWKLPIPAYDANDVAHARIAELSELIETEVAELEWPTRNFVTVRRRLRDHLAASPLGQELDALTREVVA